MHFRLIAPWESDPRRWLRLRCTDRYSAHSFAVTASGATGGQGVARVRTYRDVLEAYAAHPESKSAASGGQPCGRLTVGELQRRTVDVGQIVYVGKESNRIEEAEAGVLHDEAEYVNVYEDPRRDTWITKTLPALKHIPTGEIARALNVARSTVKRWSHIKPSRAAQRS